MSDPGSVSLQSARLQIHYWLTSLIRLGTISSLLWVTGGLVTAWLVAYSAGGSSTVYPHLFYVPIAMAALRFTWPLTLTVAVGAGLLAGPVLPADVATGEQQALEAWLLRLAMFVGVGGLMARLSRGRVESVRAQLQDALIVSRLRSAMNHGRIRADYQPILDLNTNKLVAVEALARWTDPREGEVSPGQFIPAAERTGAIRALDRFILQAAAAQVTEWSAAGSPIRACVNISATWFGTDRLVSTVQDVLTQTNLDPEQLELEVTESAIIEDFEVASKQLTQLRRLGVRIAIDDFGVGQTSFAYLARLPVDTVKIDRSLTAGLLGDTRASRLVGTLLKMLDGLGVEVVAEGIETAEHYVHAQSVGCPLGQGFYLGRPSCASATTWATTISSDDRRQASDQAR